MMIKNELINKYVTCGVESTIQKPVQSTPVQSRRGFRFPALAGLITTPNTCTVRLLVVNSDFKKQPVD